MPDKPKLLSGGNPQIPKGYGEAPIQAWLDAVPGWKQAVCRRIDRVISDMVPGVEKAVKWNTPLYGLEQDRFFCGFHCTTNYVKVSFFKGAMLEPPPPEASKQPDVRYLHIRDGDEVGEQFADWVRQASTLPGAKM